MIFEEKQEVVYHPSGAVEEIKQIRTLRRAQPLPIVTGENQIREKVVSCRRSFYFYDDEKPDTKQIEDCMKEKWNRDDKFRKYISPQSKNSWTLHLAILGIVVVVLVIMYRFTCDHERDEIQYKYRGSTIDINQFGLSQNYSVANIVRVYNQRTSEGASIQEVLEDFELSYRPFLHDFEWEGFLNQVRNESSASSMEKNSLPTTTTNS